MHHDVLDAFFGDAGKFQVEQQGAAFDAAAAPHGFHLLHLPGYIRLLQLLCPALDQRADVLLAPLALPFHHQFGPALCGGIFSDAHSHSIATDFH